MARKWLDLPWIQFKDWALGKLTSGGSSADFECPDEIPPLLALKNESGSSRKMVPACLTCEEDADGNLALCVMAQIKAGAVTVGAVTGPIGTGVAPGTNAPVYIAGLDTNATPKVVPIRVTDTTGVVHTILTAGTADVGNVGLIGRTLLSTSLAVTTTGATATLTPTAGKQIRVHGVSGAVVVESATVTGNSWSVGLNTSSKSLVVVRLPIEVYTEDFAVPCSTQLPAGTYIQGATNEDVTITAGTWSDGGDEINFNVVVHYEEITP